MAHLSIDALGSLLITLDGEAINGLAYDKVWALLVYLAHSPDHPHRRDSLAGLLWPDQPEEKARASLRQALARLRQAIGDPNATTPCLLIERASIQFNLASDCSLDVAEFTALLNACTTHAHRHAETCAACAERREQAVALYRGAFLDNFSIDDSDLFEEWATLVRESLHQQTVDALTSLAIYHERHGNYAQALQHSERQLELDPWREEAYRQIMRMLALNGQRSAALQRYERCRSVLEAELGVEPSPETTTLYEQIRASELGGPVKTDYLALPTQRHRGAHWALPLQPTPFIGRQSELSALADLIADPQCRLITLLGPGGVGKTRLALQVAGEGGETFIDGAIFVSLAPLNAAELIVTTVTSALNLTLAHRTTPQTELLHYLRQKEMLLILDNYEHLLAPSQAANENGSATELLSAILQQAPDVTMLVTTRERLNIQGEWVFDVAGLEMPDGPYRGSELEAYSAVALFLQTARRVQKEFNPTAVDRAAIVRICQLVQGMPLALELAAVWVRMLSCREIEQEIEQSLGFLTTTLRDLPKRHRSLSAVFDHSWRLLSPQEQTVFAGCSVFRGGFTREAAAQVAGASLPVLAALVDKSLLRRRLDGRYVVHELARQYAATQLDTSQLSTQTRNRHLRFFMHFAEKAEPQISGGGQVAQWHDWVESEHDNLRAALDWSLNGGEFEPGLRIVAALWEFWMNRNHAPEGQSHAERFLARPEAAAHTVLRAKALHTAGVCAFYLDRTQSALAWFMQGEAIGRELGASGKFVLALGLIGQAYTRLKMQCPDAVEALSREALSLGQEVQNAWVQGDALNQLANLAWLRGDMESARRYYLQSLEACQAGGNSYMRGYVLQGLGALLSQQGDFAAAHARFLQGLAIFEEVGDRVRVCTTFTHLGRLAIAQGSDAEAAELLERALTVLRETSHLLARINPLDILGRLAQRQGDYTRAHTLHKECLALSIEIEHQTWIARTLEAFAYLAARQANADTAARLFGATERFLTPAMSQFDPIWHVEHDQWVAATRAQLGAAAFATAWAAGAAMTLDEAVALIEAPPQP